MKLNIYQIDAFAKKPFEGNPAAVVPLLQWLPDNIMQAIAEENNLAETAFFVPSNNGFAIRWFTPKKEIALCGHATLAAAFVLNQYLNYSQDVVEFESQSGVLRVRKLNNDYQLDFPNQPPSECDIPSVLVEALGAKPSACYAAEDLIAVFDNEQQIQDINPDEKLLAQLPLRGVIVTAAAKDYDFVARFFAPKYGIPEDPVTGSAYTQLTPYWASRLDKTELSAKQLSKRGGELGCVLNGERVMITGSAVSYMVGEITLPEC